MLLKYLALIFILYYFLYFLFSIKTFIRKEITNLFIIIIGC